MVFYFFFSSRRRHTRLTCDWSSDVCSPDLVEADVRSRRDVCFDPDDGYVDTPVIWRADLGAGDTFTGPAIVEEFGSTIRSEERRVGKECRSRWAPWH